MQRLDVKIDFVIDINPAKQNKYLAGSGIKINSPDKILSQLSGETDIIVMNSNYLEEIKSATNNKFQYYTVDYGQD